MIIDGVPAPAEEGGIPIGGDCSHAHVGFPWASHGPAEMRRKNIEFSIDDLRAVRGVSDTSKKRSDGTQTDSAGPAQVSVRVRTMIPSRSVRSSAGRFALASAGALFIRIRAASSPCVLPGQVPGFFIRGNHV